RSARCPGRGDGASACKEPLAVSEPPRLWPIHDRGGLGSDVKNRQVGAFRSGGRSAFRKAAFRYARTGSCNGSAQDTARPFCGPDFQETTMLMQHVYRPTFRWITALFLVVAACGQALADPPSRVARLSYIGGHVSPPSACIDESSEARINRPLISRDNLYTDRASRVDMEIGAATLRLDERSSFGLLDLDDYNAQVELTAGTLNLTVRRLFEGQTDEV